MDHQFNLIRLFESKIIYVRGFFFYKYVFLIFLQYIITSDQQFNIATAACVVPFSCYVNCIANYTCFMYIALRRACVCCEAGKNETELLYCYQLACSELECYYMLYLNCTNYMYRLHFPWSFGGCADILFDKGVYGHSSEANQCTIQ